MSIRVVQVGLGPIGAAVLGQVVRRRGFELVAAVDIDPQKQGRDVGEFAGLDRAVGTVVSSDLSAALQAYEADVAILCTTSALQRIMPDLEALLAAGLPVVSTTEELSYPMFANPDLAQRIDELASAAGVAVVGTGVNPGFAMDTLPLLLTTACERVDSVTVERVQDASQRRLPFQRKIGAGLTPEAFRARVAEGSLGHVGLTESIAMIAATFGWRLDRITDEIEPKIAPEPVASSMLSVEAGRVCGIVQEGVGYGDGEPLIRLHMQAFLGAPQSYDRIRVEGSPALTSTVEGGIPGDVTTASVTVNTLRRVLEAKPGLRAMSDLPIPSWWSGLDAGA